MKQYYATINPLLLLTALLEYIRYSEGCNETILCYNYSFTITDCFIRVYYIQLTLQRIDTIYLPCHADCDAFHTTALLLVGLYYTMYPN